MALQGSFVRGLKEIMNATLSAQGLALSKPPLMVAAKKKPLWGIRKNLQKPNVIMVFTGIMACVPSEDMNKVLSYGPYSLVK